MKIYDENNLKEFILSRVSQEEILSMYLNIEVKFRGRKSFVVSPLRQDNRPTCGFYKTRSGKVKFKDFSGDFLGDCFDVVKRVTNTSSFKEACYDIIRMFNLEGDTIKYSPSLFNKQKESYEVKKTEISIKRRNFVQEDLDYWNKYNISLEILKKFFVFPCKTVFINDYVIDCSKEKAYGFYLGKDKWKIYFPDRSLDRFRTNANRTFMGLDFIPKKGDFLIITKSYKDIMSLYSLGFPAISPQGEGNNFDEEFIKSLLDRFDKVISLFDFDRSGVIGANKLKKLKVKPFFLTNGRFKTKDWKAKDISDLIRFNTNEVHDFIKTLNNYKNE